jgi:hypothetical protein
MATFSREFLRSLAQPSFQQGLFTAARGIGMRPQMQALQQQQQAERGLESQAQKALLSKDFSQLGSLISQMRPEVARTYIPEYQRGLQTSSEQEAGNEIAKLRSEIRDVASDTTMTADEKAIRIRSLQDLMNDAAKGLSFTQQQQVAGLGAQITQNVEAQQRAEAAEARAVERYDEWAEGKGFREERMEFARQKMSDYAADGTLRDARREQTRLTELTRQARNAYLRGGEQAREAFLAQNPGAESVWEDMSNQETVTQANIERAKETLRSATFDYTAEQLTEMGVTEEQQKIIDALPSGSAKNAALHKTLLSNASAGELPSAQMASLFAKAAEQRIMEVHGLDVDDEDDLAEIRSRAAALGLRAAQEAKSTGNIENGFMAIGSYSEGDDINAPRSGKTQSEDEMDAFIEAQS